MPQVATTSSVVSLFLLYSGYIRSYRERTDGNTYNQERKRKETYII